MLLLLFIASTFFACTDEEVLSDPQAVATFQGKSYTQAQLNEERAKLSEVDLNTALEDHFGISKVEQLASDSKLAAKLKVNLSDEVTAYTLNNSTSKFYISEDAVEKNVYHFFKVNLQKNKDLEVVNSLTFQIDDNAVVVIKDLASNDKVFSKRRLAADTGGLCQQEPQDNGSASACISREYDEFTADLVGWLAFHSNPQIAILMAAMCSC